MERVKTKIKSVLKEVEFMGTYGHKTVFSEFIYCDNILIPVISNLYERVISYYND